jgi:hypothetical protein
VKIVEVVEVVKIVEVVEVVEVVKGVKEVEVIEVLIFYTLFFLRQILLDYKFFVTLVTINYKHILHMLRK